jgi:hypothetical protein
VKLDHDGKFEVRELTFEAEPKEFAPELFVPVVDEDAREEGKESS